MMKLIAMVTEFVNNLSADYGFGTFNTFTI